KPRCRSGSWFERQPDPRSWRARSTSRPSTPRCRSRPRRRRRPRAPRRVPFRVARARSPAGEPSPTPREARAVLQGELVPGDIPARRVEAIVSGASAALRGGGGVDGAIHRAGGPAILEECRGLGGCPPGDARVTGAGRLSARYVVHAVGPVWRGGRAGEDELL